MTAEIIRIREINGNDKIFFGTDKESNERIYITKPSFDCGWYWSFGYLGNRNTHYHLEAYQTKYHVFKLEDGKYKYITEKRNINMYDALKADYDLNPKIEENLWTFCELARTIYTLKQTAEIYHIGGSHYTTNPCEELLKSEQEERRLNDIVIPTLCQSFWDLISD